MPDIQHMIFPLCIEDNSRKSTLAALARTCSQFYGSAMDALWYKIDGLGPLMHSMPPHLICEHTRPSSGSDTRDETDLHFAREPSPEEWNAMFLHAHRVRDLSLGLSSPRWGKATSYSANVLPMILRYVQMRLDNPTSTPMFPNLLVLRCRWHPAFDIIYSCMSRLVNPNIRSLRIYGNASQNSREFPSVNRFLSTLTKSYPHIENFSVLIGFAAQDVFARSSTELSELAISLPRLRVFHSNIVVDKSALAHLCSSPNLTSLIVRIPEITSLPATNIALPCLRTVNIFAPNMESTTVLLEALRAPSLSTLDIQFSASCSTTAVHRCFQALQAFPSLSSLRLWADRIAWRFCNYTSCPISSHTLRLLYSLRQIQDIRIEEHFKVDMHDDDALEMAKAWPNLRRLVFTSFMGMDDEDDFPQLTIESLLYFTKHCPELRQLGLSFDPSFVDVNFLDHIKPDSVAKHLDVLEVYPPLAEVESPSDVAQFLHRVFPHLQSLRFGDADLAMTHGWLLVAP